MGKTRIEPEPVAAKGKKTMEWTELAQHNTPKSLMVAIRGRVYDVTEFLDRHPGGVNALLAGAGRDVTEAFESYHDEEALAPVLSKYYVADLVSNELPVFPAPNEFHRAIRERVAQYFKDTNQDSKFAWPILGRYAFVYGLMAVSYYAQFFFAPVRENLIMQLVFAVLLGWGGALLGLIPMHDSSHFSFTHSPLVWNILGASHDFLNGASFLNWTYQHVLGHHPYTNIANADPDVVTADPDVRRIKPSQTWYSNYVNQELFVPFLYAFLAVKTRIQDPQLLYVEKRNDTIRVNEPTGTQNFTFWAGKAFWVFHRIVVPLYMVSWWKVLLLLAAADAMSSYWLAILFQVNHVVTDVAWPLPDEKGRMNNDWAVHQIQTSQDYAHDSWFWTLASGALNYQVVHHIFPGINQYYYPQIAPIVKQACKEFGVPFNVKDTFGEAFYTHFDHLRVLGRDPNAEKKSH